MSESNATDANAALAEAVRRRDLPAFLAQVPYARLLGLTGRWEGDEPLVCMPASERVIGNPVLPALHGGAIGGLLESAAFVRVIWMQGQPVVPKVINLTVEYLRPGQVVDTWARASITKEGRRVVNVQVRAFQSDEQKPIAIAHGHLLIDGPE